MLTKKNIKYIYPLSPLQEGMFFHFLFDPSSSAYFEQVSFRARGDLDVNLIEKSLNEIMKRYDILRTVFVKKTDRFLQVVLKERDVIFYYEDISGKQSKDQIEYINKYKEEDRKKLFDLTKDVLMRVTVIQLDKYDFAFIWSHHHILMDGWCLTTFFSDFFNIYNSFLLNTPYLLPPVIPYRVYIDWLEKQDRETSGEYWRKYLANYEEAVGIPKVGAPKGNEVKYKSEVLTSALDEYAVEGLKELAGKEKVTLNHIIQAVWGIILGKYNRKQDVVYGVVVSGRPAEIDGVETIVGLFINTVPVRIRYEDHTSFQELLQQVARTAVESEPHHYYLLAKIQADSALKQNLLDHFLAFESYPIGNQLSQTPDQDKTDNNKKGLQLEISDVDRYEQTNYDFNIAIIPAKELSIDIKYNGNVYPREIVAGIVEHFKRVVEQIIHNKELKIADITLLSDQQKNQLLVDLNLTASEYPKNKTLCQLFAQQVERLPGHLALVGAAYGVPGRAPGQGSTPYTMHLTYGELKQKSVQLARLLHQKGAGPDAIVGIMVDPSLEMIIGLLGILQAGGAYLPVDPGFPAERIQYMLEDTQSNILLTQKSFWNNSKNFQYEGEVIDIMSIALDSQQQTSVRGVVNPTGLAYVLYTSGSTGKPKGVMVEHRNVIRLIKNSNYIDFAEGDRLLLTGNFIFDITTFEIWGPLLNNITLYLGDQAIILEIEQLKAALSKNRITILHLVPQLFNQLAAARGGLEIFASLNCFLVGGDLVRPENINKLRKKFNRLKILHMYGPTENTTFSTYYVVEKAFDVSIPIGKPISNSYVYVVGEDINNLQPPGIAGELVVGGSGVARGYLNNVELSGAQFIENPYIAGDRLYRTGDMARWLPGGNLEFLGRHDLQVKIRGIRLELGEIESQLLKHARIKEAVVMVRKGLPGVVGIGGSKERDNKYLCAYIVVDSDKELSIPQLREFMSDKLPNYMMPAHFVTLTGFPLTAAGKIDRQALPAPGELPVGGAVKYTAPRDEIEEKLEKIWTEVLFGSDILETKPIGIDDNFFELGGHSLKATVLASKIHKQLNVRVPLPVIFKNPTIRELAGYIKGAVTDKYISIQPVEKKDYYILSSAQKRLYILQQMEKGSIVYNIPQIIPLSEAPDVNQLEETIKRLIYRHESLRTSFHMLKKEPVQKLHDHGEVKFAIKYFEETEEVSQADLVFKFVRPFDLTRVPLLRVILVKIPKEEYVLFIDLHHIISDGVSNTVLNRDFYTLSQGRELPLLRLQYKDFSEWHNSDAQKKSIQQQEIYWLKEFARDIPVLELPVDYPRPLFQSYEGRSMLLEIDEEQLRKLRELARAEHVTLYMVLLAVCCVLLSKLSSREDIIIGTPIAGRRHADLEIIIGMFVNTLALRNYPSGEKTFKTFLAEVKERTLQAFENQEYQFEELVETLTEKESIQRDAGRNPLFDVMFSLNNVKDDTGEPSETESDGRVRAAPNPSSPPPGSEERTAKFDLSIVAEESPQKLFFMFQYCTKLFKEETMQRFIEYFKQLLLTVPAAPGLRLSEIEIISAEENKQLLVDFNDSEADYPKDKTLCQLFREQLEKTPDNIALIGMDTDMDQHPDHQLSYREFNDRCHQLALLLSSKGIQPGDVVGIMVERSFLMVVGIWGILQAGAAYMPIDPDYPEERIRYMLADSTVKILLTSDAINRVPTPHHLSLNLSTLSSSQTLTSILTCQVSPANLAYVIYTSGSTGIPKGVMVEHSAVVNILSSLLAYYPFDENDAYLLKTSFIFDVSVTELFGWFHGGGRLAVLEKGGEMDPQQIVETVARYTVTHINFVPSMFGVLVDWLKPGTNRQLASLKYIFLAGEALPGEMLRRFKDINQDVEVENIYGPTEATIYAARYSLSEWNEKDNIPIGKPMGNLKLYVVDRYDQVQARGVVGELCISGVGVARGYLNRVELTAKSFYRNPFDKKQRFYRTGDLARWQGDGNIEFLGRIDQQVKIRGFRIELGEIESRLLEHDEVKEAAVIVIEETAGQSTIGTGDKYLCAYIVPDGADAFGEGTSVAAKLREFLSLSLPGYMIPGYFTPLEKIPLTNSEKIDRKALPKPEVSANKEYIAPRDEIEKTLEKIWIEVLFGSNVVNVTPIGIDDNFFELGGQSLKATVMASRVHKELNVRVPLAELFKTPTIRGLAGYIRGAAEDKYISIGPVEKKDYYILSHAQKRIYIVQQMDPRNTFYNMPWPIPLSGEIDIKKLETTIKSLIRRHESLRTSFHMLREEPVQRVHGTRTAAFALEHYRETREGDLQRILKEFVRPFDLSRAPLLRVGVVKTVEEEYMLVVDMHHIISDVVSIRILTFDFSTLYKGGRLAPMRIRYKDFSEWNNCDARRKRIEQQQAYWLNEFADEIPLLGLPLDYPRPAIQSYEGARLDSEISSQHLWILRKMAASEGTTLFMLLLALFYVLFSRLTGQEDIIIGTPVAGRRHADLEMIIGMFVNTLPLRNFPKREQSFSEFLQEMKKRTLEAFENQECQFEDLVEQLSMGRDPSRNPLFDILFTLNPIEEGGEDMNREKAGGQKDIMQAAKFDLTITASESRRKVDFSIQYCIKLFKKETITMIIKNFNEVLSAVTGNKEVKLKDIEITHDVIISKPTIPDIDLGI